MENPNLETNDWDWEFIPNSDEHNHSTNSPSFGDRSGGVGVIRSDHFSLEGDELDSSSWVDHGNQGFNGIEHLGFSDHFAKSSEIVLNSGNNDIEIINSVTGFSDHVANSAGIAQNSGNNDVEISYFAKSSEIVQNSEVERHSLTGFSDNLAKSLGIVQNSENNDVGIVSVTGFSDHSSKPLEIVHQNSGNEEIEITSVTGFSGHPSKTPEIVYQNSGNEEVEINSEAVLSDHSSKSSEIGYENNGNDDAESFSGDCAEEQEQEQHGSGESAEEQEQEQRGDCLNFKDDEENKSEPNKNENEKRVVWWKVPLEVLKYCVLRVSPVWSLSMAAAALMGFVLLRRRYLYKMKRKSMGVQVNVTVHDKKASQLMSQAARLNEVFSVVKRVPIIRPALPAPGMASWPVMSLR